MGAIYSLLFSILHLLSLPNEEEGQGLVAFLYNYKNRHCASPRTNVDAWSAGRVLTQAGIELLAGSTGPSLLLSALCQLNGLENEAPPRHLCPWGTLRLASALIKRDDTP